MKHEQSIDCGGGYVKLFPSDLNQEDMHGDSVYNIMFGECEVFLDSYVYFSVHVFVLFFILDGFTIFLTSYPLCVFQVSTVNLRIGFHIFTNLFACLFRS